MSPLDLGVRFGRTDISPSSRLPLGGYTDRKGVLMLEGGDPLCARILVLEQGAAKVVIASLEMLTIPESLLREVQARIPKDTNLFLTATHTHCSPDSQMLNERMVFPIPGIATYRKDELPKMADRIASAIQTSLSSPLLRSRVSVRQAEVQLNRGRRSGAIPIPTATQIELGPIRLHHYAAHATNFGSVENRTRGDWPGALMTREGGITLVGAIGDVSPAGSGSTVTQRIDSMVDGLTNAWSKAKRTALDGTLTYERIPVALPKPVPHPTFAASYKVPEALAQTVVKGFAPPEAVVTIVRLGRLALIGIPGEPTSALARRIQEVVRSKGIQIPLVMSHVNGWMGYILEPDDYDRGGYEATLAFHGREVADRIVEACAQTSGR